MLLNPGGHLSFDAPHKRHRLGAEFVVVYRHQGCTVFQDFQC